MPKVLQEQHLEASGRRVCFRRSAWRLGVCESASGVACGCVCAAESTSGAASGGPGSPKVLQASRLGAWVRRECFRRSAWRLGVDESASGVESGCVRVAESAAGAAFRGATLPKVLHA